MRLAVYIIAGWIALDVLIVVVWVVLAEVAGRGCASAERVRRSGSAVTGLSRPAQLTLDGTVTFYSGPPNYAREPSTHPDYFWADLISQTVKAGRTEE